jgi:thiol-disulfide isomerase/thioredoxin
MSRLAALLTVLAAVVLVAAWWRARDGRLRSTESTGSRFTPDQLARLGIPPGAAALIEFTAPHCAPCAAARRVLERVAEWHSVAVVPVDVGDALDLARAHHVLRTPTTFVVAADGSVRGRVSGVPNPADLIRLLG